MPEHSKQRRLVEATQVYNLYNKAFLVYSLLPADWVSGISPVHHKSGTLAAWRANRILALPCYLYAFHCERAD